MAGLGASEGGPLRSASTCARQQLLVRSGSVSSPPPRALLLPAPVGTPATAAAAAALLRGAVTGELATLANPKTCNLDGSGGGGNVAALHGGGPWDPPPAASVSPVAHLARAGGSSAGGKTLVSLISNPLLGAHARTPELAPGAWLGAGRQGAGVPQPSPAAAPATPAVAAAVSPSGSGASEVTEPIVSAVCSVASGMTKVRARVVTSF